MALGPIQILVAGFAGDDFTGKILPELRALDEKGFIKIIDLLFAKKDIKGNIFALIENELTADEAVRFGSIAGTLIGLGISEDEGSWKTKETGYFASAENDFASNLKEMADVIEKIPLDSSFVVVLIEQCWTIELKDNITKAGGVLLAQGQLSPLSLVNIGAEIAEASKAPVKR
jgi:uncharacterized membrane protein